MHEEINVPAYVRCIRLDSVPAEKAQYTEEGYLVDTPILTSVGIFEYVNPDGSIRRELRLPEHVFKPESLASYEGKPIIVTHDAGKVDKNNVSRESVGTILTKGYEDGENVRAKIVVHDTNELQRCGLKELSLGYSLDLIEEQGEWNGQHYDAIQTNIFINHLALVANARAGDQARLNIDGKEKQPQKGGKTAMKKSMQKSKRTRKDSDDTAIKLAEQVLANAGENPALTAADDDGEMSLEEKVQEIKDRKDSEEEKTEPTNLDEANEIIARQDEDIATLLEALEAQQAEKDFADGMVKQDNDDEPATNNDDDDPAQDTNNDDDDENNPADPAAKTVNNADALDRALRERLKVIRTGDSLNLDGLEDMSLNEAKKAIIRAINPDMRLDGKSETYIRAAYDIAVNSMKARKTSVSAQRDSMYGGAARKQRADSSNKSMADAARQKMIAGGKK